MCKLRNLILSARGERNYRSWEDVINGVHWDGRVDPTSFLGGMTNPLADLATLFLGTQAIRKLGFGKSIIQLVVPQTLKIKHVKTHEIPSQPRWIPRPQEVCSLLGRHRHKNTNLMTALALVENLCREHSNVQYQVRLWNTKISARVDEEYLKSAARDSLFYRRCLIKSDSLCNCFIVYPSERNLLYLPVNVSPLSLHILPPSKEDSFKATVAHLVLLKWHN